MDSGSRFGFAMKLLSRLKEFRRHATSGAISNAGVAIPLYRSGSFVQRCAKKSKS